MKRLGTVVIHDGFVSESRSWCGLFPPSVTVVVFKKSLPTINYHYYGFALI